MANVHAMKNGDSTGPDFAFEQSVRKRGFNAIAGIDEVGRGPWAGPVVAAAVVLDLIKVPTGLNDSKKLKEADREHLFEQLQKNAHVGVGVGSVTYIDENNILKATFHAMSEALANLQIQADYALVDGNRSPQLPCPHETVVKGDGRSLSIAAASIIAKVTRDRLMVGLADQFPVYGFERHKGYGTKQHQDALARSGPCAHHRSSFAPIKALLEMDSFQGR